MEAILLILNLIGVIVSAVINEQYYMANITGTLFFVLEGAILLIEVISLVIALKRSATMTEEIAVNKATKNEEESKKKGLGTKRIFDFIVVAIITIGINFILVNTVNYDTITNYRDELLSNQTLEEEFDFEDDEFDYEEDDDDFYADANYEYEEEETTTNTNTATNATVNVIY